MKLMRAVTTTQTPDAIRSRLDRQFQQSEYKSLGSTPLLVYQRGSLIGSFMSFTPSNWFVRAYILFTALGDTTHVAAVFDVNTIGQIVTRRERRFWEAEADSLAGALEGEIGSPPDRRILDGLITTFEREWMQTHRPLGVWLLTLWDGLFAGLLPAALAGLLYFRSAGQQTISTLELLLSVLLGLAIVITAVGTWRGHNWGRLGLVILLGIHYGLLAFKNLYAAQSGLLADAEEIRAWSRGIRSALTLALNVWYFFLSRARLFYQRGPEGSLGESAVGRKTGGTS